MLSVLKTMLSGKRLCMWFIYGPVSGAVALVRMFGRLGDSGTVCSSRGQ